MDSDRKGQWGQQRWLQLWSRLRAHGDGQLSFVQLAAAYTEPNRQYHTLEHIRDCLAELDDCCALARYPDELEAGIWFHDAVYQPGASDNEERSADLAGTILLQAGVLRNMVDRIADLVLVTKHVSSPRDEDQQLICDIDLTVLGRESSVFVEFERRIRQEYAWVPDNVYRRERSAVLSGFLARASIYFTPRFRERYEARARANISELLAQLNDAD
jgi:predicted metal-dependent HD superfamily phosphohydrolase